MYDNDQRVFVVKYDHTLLVMPLSRAEPDFYLERRNVQILKELDAANEHSPEVINAQAPALCISKDTLNTSLVRRSLPKSARDALRVTTVSILTTVTMKLATL